MSLFYLWGTKMKRFTLGLLLASIAGAAGAADMSAARAPYTKAPMMGPAINWSGFYIGAMGGYAAEATSAPLAIKGGFAGGTLGYNWQFGTYLLGLEADGAWADVSQSVTVAGLLTASDKLQALSTIRGRVGVAFDQVLLYGTGGFALADEKASATALGITLSNSQTRTGWTAGAGLEWMFAPHWSLKAEYLYRRFDSVTFLGVPTGSLALNSGQFGINYHF
jgi:outer membrane immunogenic protein